jgi:hypothetical protein
MWSENQNPTGFSDFSFRYVAIGSIPRHPSLTYRDAIPRDPEWAISRGPTNTENDDVLVQNSLKEWLHIWGLEG